jgi:hypothetical protein
MQRRTFLKAGAAVVMTAPFASCSAASRALVERTTLDLSRPFTLAAQQVARDGYPTHFALSQTQAFQGGAIKVSADQGTNGTARVFGRTYELEPSANGPTGFVGFGTEDPPGPASITIDLVDNGGQPVESVQSIEILKTQWTVDHIIIPPPDPNAPPPPPGLVDEQSRLNDLYAGVTPRKWRDKWAAPLPLPLAVSGYFGEQRSFNGGPVQGHHGGTDLAADAGTPTYATNDGTVVLAERVLTRGNLVVIDHGGGIFSCYGHHQELRVKQGDVVAQGDNLGLVGTTGLSTGPHLHWEMSVAGVLVDGLRWLDGTQGF